MLVKQVFEMPKEWEDPILPAAMVAALMQQPGHLLLEYRDPDNPEFPPAHLFARVVPYAPADVLTIYTPPPLRRKGIAHALLNDFLARLQDKNCPQVTLEVRASNAPARNLYESFGFTESLIRNNYYNTPTEDALVLSKPLAESEPESF